MRLTKKAFESWLKEKDPDEIVGYSRDIKQCPVAKFLGAYCVGYHEWTPDDRVWHPLPQWAGNLAFAVDGAPGAVTASQALEILRVGI